jgi:probable addiction module antidote protein
MRKFRTHGEYLEKSLRDPREAALYHEAAAAENAPALLLVALAQVVKAHGISSTARKVALSRAGIYKTISKSGNPELKTFMGILKVSGLQMSFKPLHPQHH